MKRPSTPLPRPRRARRSRAPSPSPSGRAVQRILSEAGFADVVLTPEELELDIAVGQGLDAAVAAALTIGPASRMLENQSDAVRAAAATDIRAALAAHAVGDSVSLGASVWIVTARNSGLSGATPNDAEQSGRRRERMGANRTPMPTRYKACPMPFWAFSMG